MQAVTVLMMTTTAVTFWVVTLFRSPWFSPLISSIHLHYLYARNYECKSNVAIVWDRCPKYASPYAARDNFRFGNLKGKLDVLPEGIAKTEQEDGPEERSLSDMHV
jgi:hypothetical protein